MRKRVAYHRMILRTPTIFPSVFLFTYGWIRYSSCLSPYLRIQDRLIRLVLCKKHFTSHQAMFRWVCKANYQLWCSTWGLTQSSPTKMIPDLSLHLINNPLLKVKWMLLNNVHARLRGLFNNIHWAWGEELFQYNCIIAFEFCWKYIFWC